MTPTRRAPAVTLRISDTVSAGILLALGTALISGFAIWLNGFGVKQVPDAALYTTLKNGVAAIVLFAAAAALIRPVDLRAIDRRTWVRLGVVGVIGGSIPFVLFFSGLAMASAPSAAFIHKTLFIWVAIAAVPLLGERLGWVQIGALIVLLVGQALVLSPAGLAPGTGETLIAAATLLWAAEVIVAKRLLATVPTPVVAASRMGIGLTVLVGYLAVSGRLALVPTVTAEGWGWVALTGLVLAGYVGTWFAALRRAPASVVTSVLVVGAVVTGALQALSSGTVPAAATSLGYLFMLGGALALGMAAARFGSRPVLAEANAG
jgi:drug/metabolite transporter (DMT)-like permease